MGPGPGPPFEQVTRRHFSFSSLGRKADLFLVFGLNTIKIEGIRRFHRSDEIRREKLHLLVYITPLETSFESSHIPNMMLMDDDDHDALDAECHPSIDNPLEGWGVT